MSAALAQWSLAGTGRAELWCYPARVAARVRSGERWLALLRRRMETARIDVEVGSPDALEILARQDAAGLAICDEQGATILLRGTPTASEVLEEYAHVLQIRRNDHADLPDAQEVLHAREVAVKECLLANAGHFSPVENEQTQAQLELHATMLAKLRERWR